MSTDYRRESMQGINFTANRYSWVRLDLLRRLEETGEKASRLTRFVQDVETKVSHFSQLL